MTQDELWLKKYQEVKAFIETNRRNPSRHNPSIIIAGPDKLPAISRYYHDAAPGNALVPEGMQLVFYNMNFIRFLYISPW